MFRFLRKLSPRPRGKNYLKVWWRRGGGGGRSNNIGTGGGGRGVYPGE